MKYIQYIIVEDLENCGRRPENLPDQVCDILVERLREWKT